jgi:polysaccharide biosynthesis/export protein
MGSSLRYLIASLPLALVVACTSLVKEPISSSVQLAADKDARNLSNTQTSHSADKAYWIGPSDILYITVFNVPDLSRTVQVSDVGTISYPLVGEVPAAGKSARELEAILSKQLKAKYLKNAQVTVFVQDFRSQRVTVEGAVKKPGMVPVAGSLSLLQAIAQSDGLDEIAESSALILREVEGKRRSYRYDIADIRAGRADDPELQSGDVIVVPTSDLKTSFNRILNISPLATVASTIK